MNACIELFSSATCQSEAKIVSKSESTITNRGTSCSRDGNVKRDGFKSFRKWRRSEKLRMNQVGENFEALYNPRSRASEKVRTIRGVDPA
jgi:hypothetical protein